MKESLSNIRTVCSNCRKPIKIDFPPEELIGKWVKKRFTIGKDNEHMWVEVKGITADGLIQGVLDNDSIFDPSLISGIELLMNVSEIEQVYEK